MSAPYHVIRPPVQSTISGAHLHTPQSIFQHMMGQPNASRHVPGPWLQPPQVPQMSMPWSIPALQQPDLIRFTGITPSKPRWERRKDYYKRKLEEPDLVELRPTKQFITEEKMAAHFQDMHISTNYTDQNPIPSTSTACEQQSASDPLDAYVDLADIEPRENNEQPRLVISEEIRRMQQEPMLPASLLSKLERPSMALVLWEPPSKHLRVLPTPRDTPTPIPNILDDDSNNNNNNNNIPDLNETPSSGISEPILEPMDL